MRKNFHWEDFFDFDTMNLVGFYVNANRFTKEQAIEIFLNESACNEGDGDIVVDTRIVRYIVNRGEDYDNTGGYNDVTDDNITRGSFKCWMVSREY